MPVTLSDEQWGRLLAASLAYSNGLAAMTHAANVSAKAVGEMVDIINEITPGLIDEMAVRQGLVQPESMNREQRRAAAKKSGRR